MSWRRHSFGNLTSHAASLAVGLVPGLILPFVIALSFSPGDADAIVLVLSVSLLLINVTVAVTETSTIASVGALRAEGCLPSRRALLSLSRRNLFVAVPVILVIAPAIGSLYAARDGDAFRIFLGVALVSAVPLVGAVGATFSGYLLSGGYRRAAILSQGFRSTVPVVYLLTTDRPEFFALLIAFVSGEFIRVLVAGALVMSQQSADVVLVDRVRLDRRSRYWQFAASGMPQMNAVVDRAYLAGGTPGDLVSLELGEKLAFAVMQLMYATRVLALIGRWSRDFSPAGSGGAQTLRRDLFRLWLITAGLAALMIGAVVLSAQVFQLPQALELGLTWSITVLASIPFALMMTASIRLLVIFDRSRTVFLSGVIALLLTVVLNFLLLALLGSYGVVLAGAIVRVCVSVYLVALVLRLARLHDAGASGRGA